MPRLLALAWAAGACWGCGGDRTPDAVPTFSGEVAAILYENCAPCHRPGEAAPFSLLSYRDARRRGEQIVEVTAAGLMPPWLPEPDVNRFEGERRLSADQIQALQRWFEGGMPAGEPDDAPDPPPRSTGWALGPPDLVVAPGEPYVLPAGGTDVFRSFVVAQPSDRARWVRAFEFRPGNARVVHHATLKVDATRSSRRRDLEDPGPGYAGMHAEGARDPDGQFLGWVPGRVPSPGSPDMAWRLGPRTDLVLELHMVPSGKPETVRPSVGLYFTEQPPQRVPTMLRLGSRTLDIPAGAADHPIEDRYTLPVDVRLLAIYPHAHYLGKRMWAWADLPDGTRRWLLRIDRWDFNWQDAYRYVEPPVLPRGSVLTMRFAYDNSVGNPSNPHHPPRRVRYGPRTADEMGDLWIQGLPVDEGDTRILEADLARVELARDIEQYEGLVAEAPGSAPAHNNLAGIYHDAGRSAEALEHMRRAVELDPDYAQAQKNLGTLLQVAGRLDQALAPLVRAIELEPDDADAHLRLAGLLAALGRTDSAIAACRDAVRVDPGFPGAHFNLGLLLERAGRASEALDAFLRAGEQEPSWHLPPLHAAALLVTHPGLLPDGSAEALRLARQAAGSVTASSSRVAEVLAAALAGTGRFAEAVVEAERALGLAGDAGTRSRLAGQLEHYRTRAGATRKPE